MQRNGLNRRMEISVTSMTKKFKIQNNQRNYIPDGEDYKHSVYKIDDCMYLDEFYEILIITFKRGYHDGSKPRNDESHC